MIVKSCKHIKTYSSKKYNLSSLRACNAKRRFSSLRARHNYFCHCEPCFLHGVAIYFPLSLRDLRSKSCQSVFLCHCENRASDSWQSKWNCKRLTKCTTSNSRGLPRLAVGKSRNDRKSFYCHTEGVARSISKANSNTEIFRFLIETSI